MDTDDEHTLVFNAVRGVTVREAGQTVAIEFAGSSGQTISVLLPAEASHTLSRMLMRAQIEAAATRGLTTPLPQSSASGPQRNVPEGRSGEAASSAGPPL